MVAIGKDTVGLNVTHSSPLHAKTSINETGCFLATNSPFAGQPPELVTWLAERFEEVHHDPGDIILREGDTGEALLVVRRGRVSIVSARADGSELRIDDLLPGDLFGEESLMTGEPHSATARAEEVTVLLRLSREDFKAALRYDDCARSIALVSLKRQRPKRADRTTLERQQLNSDKPVYILADGSRRRYMRLSEEGLFLWNLIDGNRTVRDLCIAYSERFQRSAAHEVLQGIAQLHAAGFLLITNVCGASRKSAPWWDKMTPFLSMSIRYFSLPDVDRFVSAVYRLIRPLFTLPAQVALTIVAAAGAAAFFQHLPSHPSLAASSAQSASTSLVLMFISLLVHAVLHEMGHAVTCKHFGREVHRAGIGWYLFFPVAFVDTSNIWAASRRVRILVSAAGPFVNLVLSGIAGLAAIFVTPAHVQDALWNFSIMGYILAVVNLNPLLEYDGYYLLMDFLEVPNLRSRSLAYLGSLILRHAPNEQQLHSVFVLFGVASLGYGLSIGISVLIAYQVTVKALLAGYVQPHGAEAIGWLLASAMGLLVLYRLIAGLDLRRVRNHR
jgi:putative peptide zinc metalloprotease protein